MRSKALLRAGMTLFALSGVLASTAENAGCAAVPDIQFVPDDARADGPSGDGAADAPDASRDAGACTTASPGAGAVCCGTAWCVGQCNLQNCDECAALAKSGACGAGNLCCGKGGTVLCKSACP